MLDMCISSPRCNPFIYADWNDYGRSFLMNNFLTSFKVCQSCAAAFTQTAGYWSVSVRPRPRVIGFRVVAAREAQR